MTSTFQTSLLFMEGEGSHLNDGETRSDLFLKNSVTSYALSVSSCVSIQSFAWHERRKKDFDPSLSSVLKLVITYQRERSVLLDDIENRRTNEISRSAPYALHFRKLLCFTQWIYQPVAEHKSHNMLMRRRLQQMGEYVDEDKTILESVAL